MNKNGFIFKLKIKTLSSEFLAFALALPLILSMLTGVAFAWKDFSQHKTNILTGISLPADNLFTLKKIVRNSDGSELTDDQKNQTFAFTIEFSDQKTYPYQILNSNELQSNAQEQSFETETPAPESSASDNIDEDALQTETPSAEPSSGNDDGAAIEDDSSATGIPPEDTPTPNENEGESEEPTESASDNPIEESSENTSDPESEQESDLYSDLESEVGSEIASAAALEIRTLKKAPSSGIVTMRPLIARVFESSDEVEDESTGLGSSDGVEEPGAEASQTAAIPTEVPTPEVSPTEVPPTEVEPNSETDEDVSNLADNLEEYDSGDTIYLKNGQVAIFRNIPEGISYIVTEAPVDGYKTVSAGATGTIGVLSPDGTFNESIFINTYQTTQPPELVTILGRKHWHHGSNPSENRPSQITLKVYADGSIVDIVTVKAEDDWQWSREFPKYNNTNGDLIEYTIGEATVSGYTAVVDGFDLTNTFVEPVSPSPSPSPSGSASPSPSESVSPSPSTSPTPIPSKKPDDGGGNGGGVEFSSSPKPASPKPSPKTSPKTSPKASPGVSPGVSPLTSPLVSPTVSPFASPIVSPVASWPIESQGVTPYPSGYPQISGGTVTRSPGDYNVPSGDPGVITPPKPPAGPSGSPKTDDASNVPLSIFMICISLFALACIWFAPHIKEKLKKRDQ